MSFLSSPLASNEWKCRIFKPFEIGSWQVYFWFCFQKANDLSLHITIIVNIVWLQVVPYIGHSSVSKESARNAEDPNSTLGWRRSPGEGNGNPLQYSNLKNPMDRVAWWTTVHGVTKSRTHLSDPTTTLVILELYFKIQSYSYCNQNSISRNVFVTWLNTWPSSCFLKYVLWNFFASCDFFTPTTMVKVLPPQNCSFFRQLSCVEMF